MPAGTASALAQLLPVVAQTVLKYNSGIPVVLLCCVNTTVDGSVHWRAAECT
jgi:hypothetical protein